MRSDQPLHLMARPPPPPFVPPPGPQVGDRVLFYFATPGSSSTRLGSRAATIVNLWTGDKTIAQLEVEFTDEEVKQWGVARTQLHTPLVTHPKSGTWVRLPVANQ